MTKNFLSTESAFCVMFLLGIMGPTNPVLAQSFTLITPVNATAEVNNADAPKTIDNNSNECNLPTFWQAAAENPSIKYDLGEVKQVAGFRESAGPFPGNPFTAFVSTDDIAYVQVASGNLTSLWPTGSCAYGDHIFAATMSVRYFKIFVQRTDNTGFGELADFRALAPAAPPNQPPNCSGATIADQSAGANCQVTVSGADVTGVTDPDNDNLTITVDPTTLSLGTNSVTVTADDGNGGACNTIITVNVVDNIAPVPDLADLPDAIGECSVTLTPPTATDNCAGSITATTSDPLTYNMQGIFTVTWTYDDGNGNSSQQTQNVIVDDVTAPTLTVSSTPISLWPPNHKYATINVSQCVTAVSDNCNNALSASDVVITEVSSDEPEDAQGGGDGNTTNDIVITSCSTVDLRAERQGGDNGRVYTIHLQVSDGNGNSSTAVCQVHVPKSQNGIPAVDDGAAAGYTVTGSCGSAQKLSRNSSNLTPIPEGYALEQNYPNPFNPTTEIIFAIPEAAEVSLSIYNIHGQLVRRLASGHYAAGQYRVTWNATNEESAPVTSGVYLYVLKAGNFTAQRRLVLMK